MIPRGLLLRACTVILLCGLVAATAYVAYLDHLITDTFAGRRWSVPAIVYAQPLELYGGSSLSQAEVTAELERLGYRQRANLEHPGVFKRTGSRLDVYLRAFDFMERNRSTQRIRVKFASHGITNISDLNGRPVPLIRLDPLTIGSFFPSLGEDRLVLQPDDVPELLPATLIAVEDAEFDRHVGFSVKGILRAAWVNLTAGEIRQGGSTLTQQLVKSYFLDNRRTFGRKLREVVMAVMLELRFDKTELLTAYINEIHLGQDGVRAIHGFGLGAQFYFNKPLVELRPQELATLVAIIRGPSYYNPFRHPERTLARRTLVLEKMRSAELLNDAELAQALGQPLGIVRGARSGGGYYPAFMDKVRAELAQEYPGDELTAQGLRVFTTLSPRTQDAVERALDEGLENIESAYDLPSGELQGAVVIADTQTGEIAALAGGRNAGFDGFNRVLNARRTVGSLLKPVIYLAALERGYHLASEIQDAPVRLPMRGGDDWVPRNFDGEIHGPVPIVRALGDSLNLATINLGLSIGVDQVAQRLTELAGIVPDNRYPSLLLGAESLTPLQVLRLYSNFASGGFTMTPKSIITVLDDQGSIATHRPFELRKQIEPANAAAMNRALEIVMQAGTGRSSRFAQIGIAGKTGTSDDYRDSWFVGYDATRVAVVWLGYDDNRSTRLTGAAGALKIWDRIFQQIAVEPIVTLESPGWQSIEYASGRVANVDCADVVQVPIPEDAALQAKAGCGINLRTLTGRLRRNLESWFRSN